MFPLAETSFQMKILLFSLVLSSPDFGSPNMKNKN